MTPSTMPATTMDRAIPRTSRRIRTAAVSLALLAAAAAAWIVTRGSGGRSLRVPRDHLVIQPVTRGPFEDVAPVTAEVAPPRSVYLDAVEGGRVERVLVEPGAQVTAGQLLVELSSPTLQLDVISREAQVTEQLNQLRDVELALEQARIAQDRERVELDYQLERSSSAVKRLRDLAPVGAVAAADVEAAEQEHTYLGRRRQLAVEAAAVNDGLRHRQLSQMRESAKVLREHLAFARRHLESLDLRAPVAGTLSALDVQVGQSLAHGQRAGQIDLAGVKLVARVDQFYADRVTVGCRARTTLAGRDHTLTVTKVYPLVESGRFAVDLAFDGDPPADLRRGQALPLRIVLGETTEAVIAPSGPFLDASGGHWIFVLSADGERATRRSITVGRRNPQQIEIVQGLAPGERVVTSSYEHYQTLTELALD
jgi:HlyD family secretion protein